MVVAPEMHSLLVFKYAECYESFVRDAHSGQYGSLKGMSLAVMKNFIESEQKLPLSFLYPVEKQILQMRMLFKEALMAYLLKSSGEGRRTQLRMKMQDVEHFKHSSEFLALIQSLSGAE
jgi:hypothetical protein